MRALVIDDSRTVRRILVEMLVPLGFEVDEAVDGREGLAVLERSEHTDVALVDWNMPHMNGLEFVQAVRSNSQYEALRLLMVTTETETEQIATALLAGANEYVMKPFDAECIGDKLRLMGIL